MPIRIVLVDTNHPGNIGAVARAMKNMGLHELHLVRPKFFPNADASARASGADDILGAAHVHEEFTDAIADCGLVVGTSARQRHLPWDLMEPRACAGQIVQASKSGEVAVILTSERVLTVTVLPDPETGPITTTDAVKSIQEAEVEMPAEIYRQMWKPEYLERLARSYWAFLTKVSLGAIRVVYEPSSRTVVFISRRLPLLRFRKPEYTIGPGLGQVTWRIERGLLVAPNGRGQGMLRITVRSDDPE